MDCDVSRVCSAHDTPMTTFIQQLVNGLSTGSTYALVALGFGLIFSVMRVLNIAHADLMMVGAYTSYLILKHIGTVGQTFPLAAAIGIYALVLLGAMTAAGASGLIIERLVIRPTRGRYLLIPFIATAGVSIALQNAFAGWFGVDAVPVSNVFTVRAFRVNDLFFTNIQVITFVTAIVMLLALRYYVRNTRWGVATRAVAERPAVASSCGINVNQVSR
jgi:branched-chain amino acid transport system permease protein